MTSDPRVRGLALEIARCPVIEMVLAGGASPCREVVNYQTRPAPRRWPAEPWIGDLHAAPILFIGSNPPDEPLPPGDLTVSSGDDEILRTFTDAFKGRPPLGSTEGTRERRAFFGFCNARARELLARPPKPGIDYAMTHVVHCASQREIGVWSAASECVPRYLQRVISLSPAVVVFVVGAAARGVVRSLVPQTARTGAHSGPFEWAGRRRHILFFPAPLPRRVPKSIRPHLGDAAPSVIGAIRRTLAEQSGS